MGKGGNGRADKGMWGRGADIVCMGLGAIETERKE